MKKIKSILKNITIAIVSFYLIYGIFLYITCSRMTILIQKGAEGTFRVESNQADGIDLDYDRIIYDFTKSKTIKIKGELPYGFYPLGYLNYYEVDSLGNRTKLEATHKSKENSNLEAEEMVVWEYYGEAGTFDQGKPNESSTETFIICKKKSLDSVLFNRYR